MKKLKFKFKTNKNNLIILFLVLISSFLIYFSTSSYNISQKYIFYDNISLNNNLTNYDGNLIGNIQIQNSGFIISKIYLKKLEACVGSNSYNINYFDSNYDRQNIFSNNYDPHFLELNPNSKQNISIKLSYYPNLRRINLNENRLLIYENNNPKNFDHFCENANTLKPIKTIIINLK